MVYDAFTQYTMNETRQMFGFHGTNARGQTIFGQYDTKKLWHAGHNGDTYASLVTMDIIPLFCHDWY